MEARLNTSHRTLPRSWRGVHITATAITIRNRRGFVHVLILLALVALMVGFPIAAYFQLLDIHVDPDPRDIDWHAVRPWVGVGFYLAMLWLLLVLTFQRSHV